MNWTSAATRLRCRPPTGWRSFEQAVIVSRNLPGDHEVVVDAIDLVRATRPLVRSTDAPRVTMDLQLGPRSIMSTRSGPRSASQPPNHLRSNPTSPRSRRVRCCRRPPAADDLRHTGLPGGSNDPLRSRSHAITSTDGVTVAPGRLTCRRRRRSPPPRPSARPPSSSMARTPHTWRTRPVLRPARCGSTRTTGCAWGGR